MIGGRRKLTYGLGLIKIRTLQLQKDPPEGDTQ